MPQACVELTFHRPMKRVRDISVSGWVATCVDDTPEMRATLLGTGSWSYYTSNMCNSEALVSASDGWVGMTGSPGWIPGRDFRGIVNYFPVRWRDGQWPTPQTGCAAGNATGCVAISDDVCHCAGTSITMSAVFTNASALPSAAEVEAALAIGAPRPSDFASGVYALCATAACSAASPAVKVYIHFNASGQLDMRSIFEIVVNGSAAFFANKEATVHMGGYSLRNPPHFMSFRTPLERDLMYETEALLGHLMMHQNTAPFIAHRLIQRLVTSNPSPRYTKVVADAFRTGMYDGVRYSDEYGSLAATMHAILLDREARSSTLDLDPTHGQLREPLLRLVHVMRAMEYTAHDGRDPEMTSMMEKIGQQVFQSPGVFNFFKPEYQALGAVIDSNLVAPEFEITYAPTILGFLNGISSLVRFGLTSCEGGFGKSQRLQPRTGGSLSRECYAPSRLIRYPSVDGQSLDTVTLKGALDSSSSDGVLNFSFAQGATMDAADVVSELDLLLTAGRLSNVSRKVIEREYLRLRDEYTYFFAWQDGSNCTNYPDGEIITTVEDCEAAARALPKPDKTVETGNWNWKPVGCFYDNNNPERLKLNSDGNNKIGCSGANDCVCRARGARRALKRATELLLATPDFAITNFAQPTSTQRVVPSQPASGGRPYKALVVLFLDGGADSWNMIVPHSGCTPGNVSTNYETYHSLRGGSAEGVAIQQQDLLTINVPNTPGQPAQPCSTLGVHPRLSAVRRLYNEGDAAFFTNVGTLVEPMTKAEYLAKEKRRPPNLFAHNVQVKVTQSMHPQDKVATGVLGRIVDVLKRGGAAAAYRTGTYSLKGMAKMVEGERAPVVLDKRGVVSFVHQAELDEALGNITLGGGAQSYKSVFGETWAQQLEDSLSTSHTLGAATSGVSLTANFPSSTLGQEFEQVARVIAARSNLQEERQVFFVTRGGFDSHASLKDQVSHRPARMPVSPPVSAALALRLASRGGAPPSQVDANFQDINAALEAFETELKAQGVWDDTILVSASDFGRTYGMNGAGTVRRSQPPKKQPLGREPVFTCASHTRVLRMLRCAGPCVGRQLLCPRRCRQRLAALW